MDVSPGVQGVVMYYKSSRCRYQDWEQPFFIEWCCKMRAPMLLHRKQWEHVFIAEALRERGALQWGRRGLALGAGGEVLPIVFTEIGCQITATDLLNPWIPHPAHPLAASSLVPTITTACVDMRAIPESYHEQYDFVWSACALDHLGSIEAGLQFIERSLDVLRPGGWAVHTTELNVDSPDETIEEGPTVFFREKDFRELELRFVESGVGDMVPLDLEPGTHVFDQLVDTPPYGGVLKQDIKEWNGTEFVGDKTHLVLQSGAFRVTSTGIIAQKK